MPPRKRAQSPNRNTDKDTYKVGDIAPVQVGELVRRPDGTVLTSGGGHALNVPGEYAFIDAKGAERKITVSEK